MSQLIFQAAPLAFPPRSGSCSYRTFAILGEGKKSPPEASRGTKCTRECKCAPKLVSRLQHLFLARG